MERFINGYVTIYKSLKLKTLSQRSLLLVFWSLRVGEYHAFRTRGCRHEFINTTLLFLGYYQYYGVIFVVCIIECLAHAGSK